MSKTKDKVIDDQNPATEAVPTTTPALRAYPTQQTDEASGEVTTRNRFKYLPGHPRQVRFDAKAGNFNRNGEQVIGKTLTCIPLAWRIFEDDILKMGRKRWAEIFFVDESGAVCAVLFHGYSVEQLYKLIEPLFYDDLTLADVQLTITADKKQTEKDGKAATYYIAHFTYETAPADEVQARAAFAQDFPIWREETVTGVADQLTAHGYRLPDREPQTALPAAEVEAEAVAG